MSADDETPSASEFAAQLIRQVYADLDGVLSAGAIATQNAFDLVIGAAESAEPRGAALYVFLKAALGAYGVLIGTAEDEFQFADNAAVAAVLASLSPRAGMQAPALARYASRLGRYIAEAEPAGRALTEALASAIRRLYEGMAQDDSTQGLRGLIELRAMIVHADAVASQLDPTEGGDRPIRVFAPDRFHDHFLKLTETVQKAAPVGDRPVAALTLGGRITALIAESDHPLEAAVDMVRTEIPGDAATKEHALLRMQGLLRVLDELRKDPQQPWAGALHDDSLYLSLVTAAATAPMAAPGRFGMSQLAQVARYNLSLLKGASEGRSAKLTTH